LPVRLGVRAALVAGGELPGDVEIEDGRVAAVGRRPAGSAGLAVPGFVDLQVNGFGGVDFLTAAAEDYEVAGAALAAVGVTAYQPTLISAPPDALRAALAEAAAARRRSPVRLLGVHLEGPFLSPIWPGTHPPEHLRDPDADLLEELLAAGPVTAVTLAPELPGGLELVESLSARGVEVRIGHTDADAATANAAFDRGATAITHIHNAHRRFAPRDPGPAGAALARADVTITIIVDGVHLADETIEAVRRAAGDRLCLVSDAIAAAGCGDGGYRLGQLDIEVRDGRSTRADGRLAGSVGPLDASVRRLVEGGAPLRDAIHAATRAPARLAGRPDLGTLAPGAPADVAVLDDGLRITRTLVGGIERFAAPSPAAPPHTARKRGEEHDL
jgi:N-acetylglucosamine-6-phosphate deacetylase